MKDLICIVCPKGCRLQVDENNGYTVTGNACERGAVYGSQEVQNPTRMITSTISVENGLYRRCPVKADKPIPKGMIGEAMETLNGICLQAPIKMGQVVVKNICGTNADFIAGRDMPEVSCD